MTAATARQQQQQQNRDMAEAMAEVAVMEGAGRGRRGGAQQQQVLPHVEATDESGELVRQRFVQFLGE
jgi:hypothetical protein